MRTLVIGLGNPILTDDGVGIYAVRALRQILAPEAAVDTLELSVGGLMLMEAMIGYERVILLDALWSPDGELGEVVQFAAGDLSSTMNTASAHDVDLPTALKVGRQLGAALPADDGIQIIGVRAQDVLSFGARPSPQVTAAIPTVVGCVLRLLDMQQAVEAPALTGLTLGGYDDIS